MTQGVRRAAQGLAAVAVVALLVLLVWSVVKREGGVSGALDSGKNPTAPLVALEQLNGTMEGKPLGISDLRGKAVIVNFWASWCIPCKDEAPFLQETYERYRDRGLVVLGINSQDLRDDARGFMDRFDLTYPIVFDGRRKALKAWGIRGFPETFFVDRTGKIVGERIDGGVDLSRNQEAFEQGIRLALGVE
jgi:thiol-disulfide isomerase/thioredoxin